MANDEANRILTDVHDAYEDARAAGESMAEAASRQRLKVVTIEAVDRSGKTPEGTILTDLPESNTLLREAFDTEVNVENPAISIGSMGFLYYEVEGVTPARERTLDEVRDQVVADWTSREADTRLIARASEIQKQLADGGDLAAIAGELGLEVQTRHGLTREATDAGLGEGGVAAAFNVGRGEAGTARGTDSETHIVFRVTEVTQPLGAGADSVPAEERTRIASGIGDDLLDQLVARLQGQYGVSIDRGAVEQALSF